MNISQIKQFIKGKSFFIDKGSNQYYLYAEGIPEFACIRFAGNCETFTVGYFMSDVDRVVFDDFHQAFNYYTLKYV